MLTISSELADGLSNLLYGVYHFEDETAIHEGRWFLTPGSQTRLLDRALSLFVPNLREFVKLT